jgi:hypothetical protein
MVDSLEKWDITVGDVVEYVGPHGTDYRIRYRGAGTVMSVDQDDSARQNVWVYFHGYGGDRVDPANWRSVPRQHLQKVP